MLDLIIQVRTAAPGVRDETFPARSRAPCMAGTQPPDILRSAPASSAAQDPELVQLIAFANALPTDLRRIFTLRKVYGLSHREIADRLSMTVGRVEELLTEVLLRLDQFIDPVTNRFRPR